MQCFYEKAISPEDVETDRIWTDFHNLPLYSHAGNEKGVWNFDAKLPADTCDFEKWDRKDAGLLALRCKQDGSKGEGPIRMQGPGSAIRRPRHRRWERKPNGIWKSCWKPIRQSLPDRFWQRRTVSGCLHQDGHGHSGRLWTSDHPYGGPFRCGIHVSDTVCAWTGAVHFPRGRDKLLCNGMQNLGAV